MKREEVKSSDKVASVLPFTHSKLMPDFYISALNYRFYSAGLYAVYSSRLDKYFLIAYFAITTALLCGSEFSFFGSLTF